MVTPIRPTAMPNAPRLFLITPPVADASRFAPLLEAAIGAADVACVLLRTAARDEGEAKAIVRALAPLAQAGGAALLVEGDPRFAARVDADGLHVAGAGPALDAAIDALRPRRIVGVGNLATRDDAMRAGETGADYVMFGGPDAGEDHARIVEQAAWWAEIFNVPCVAYARHPDHAAELAATGAEFVALCEGLWSEPAEVAATIRAVARDIARIEIAR